ncbi:MAG TPA: BON domain-containing protein [Terracidiphilus sp.]|jgi:hyperosmotically inducible periplasmic protein
MRMRAPACVIATISSLLLLSPPALPQAPSANADSNQQAILDLANQVRRAIVRDTLYGVFDSIHFEIQGTDTVILRGFASRPTLRSSLERTVRRINGVKTVQNEIEVLPTSINDDRLRAAVYRSIYGFGALQRYTSNRGGPNRGMPSVARMAGGITNDPPIGFHAIHIIVRNGHVILTGVVDSEADMALAGIRANIVSGVFSVDNQLQVAGRPASGG